MVQVSFVFYICWFIHYIATDRDRLVASGFYPLLLFIACFGCAASYFSVWLLIYYERASRCREVAIGREGISVVEERPRIHHYLLLSKAPGSAIPTTTRVSRGVDLQVVSSNRGSYAVHGLLASVYKTSMECKTISFSNIISFGLWRDIQCRCVSSGQRSSQVATIFTSSRNYIFFVGLADPEDFVQRAQDMKLQHSKDQYPSLESLLELSESLAPNWKRKE